MFSGKITCIRILGVRMKISAKFVKNVTEQVKKYKPIVRHLQKKQVNEANTVKVINDILADVFGYDKYTEITSEYLERGNFCDLAVKRSNDKAYMMVEVKGVTVSLNERHVMQVLSYAVNHGAKWMILTNGVDWRVYNVKYTKPIDKELVFEFNFLDLNLRDQKQLEMLFALSKTDQGDSPIDELYSNNRVKNKYIIAGLIDSPEVHKLIRKLVRVYFDNSVKITEEEISMFIRADILRHEVVESDESKVYQKILKRAMKKAASNKLVRS